MNFCTQLVSYHPIKVPGCTLHNTTQHCHCSTLYHDILQYFTKKKNANTTYCHTTLHCLRSELQKGEYPVRLFLFSFSVFYCQCTKKIILTEKITCFSRKQSFITRQCSPVGNTHALWCLAPFREVWSVNVCKWAAVCALHCIFVERSG